MRPVPNFPTYEPSHFALNKLASFEYVELWYFTREGCQDAYDNQRSVAVEGFGLTRTEDSIALKPLSTFQASKKVVKDTDLTWTQMSIAKTVMLNEMKKCGWLSDDIDCVASFYYAIDSHPYRSRDHGEPILLRYQASVRRSWFESLKNDEGFNIGIFNEALLTNIANEYMQNLQAVAIAKMDHLVRDRPLREPYRARRERSRSPRRSERRRRSASPPRRHSGAFDRRDPPLGSRRLNPPNTASRPHNFGRGADTPSPSVCAICLGRGHPEMAKCNSGVFWNGKPSRCRRNARGRVVNPDGTEICLDWQLARGCSSRNHSDRHECSGCGRSDHGAHSCHLAQTG